MKAIVEADRRSEVDKMYDTMYNKMVRKARLTPVQENVVAAYLRELLCLRIHETECAVDMGWLIALIEGEKFGTDVSRGAKRLLRAQALAAEARNEAYGKDCINANGVWVDYDGCGLEHLQVRLSRYGVEYDTKMRGD